MSDRALDDAPQAYAAAEDGAEAADARLARLRHSAAHVMAEAVLEVFPDAKFAIGPPIADGFYYDFDLPRPLTPDDLAAIERRMARGSAADHPVRIRRRQPGRGAGAVQGPAVQGGADRGAARGRDDLDLPARALRGPLPRAARAAHGRDRRVQAAQRGRGLLARRREAARCSSASTARPVATPGGAGRAPAAAGGGREARPPQARARSSELFYFSTTIGAGPAAVGTPKGAMLRYLMEQLLCASTQRATATSTSARRTWTKESLCEKSGHLGHYSDEHVPADGRWTITYWLKPMNCPIHMRSTSRSRAAIATCRCAVRSSARAVPLRANRRAHGLTRVRSFTQDDAHIFCTARADRSEVRRHPGDRRPVLPGLRPSTALRLVTRPENSSATRHVGPGRGRAAPHPGQASRAGRIRGRRGRTAPSTGRRSTS